MRNYEEARPIGISDYRATCGRGTRLDYPIVGPLEGLRVEFQRGCAGEAIHTGYLREKIRELTDWVAMLEEREIYLRGLDSDK